MGRPRTAIRPPRKISSDSTPAKIGRSMKNFERFTGRSFWSPWKFGKCSARVTVESTATWRWLRPRAVLGSVLDGARRLRFGHGHRHRLRRDERTRSHALQAVDDDAFV